MPKHQEAIASAARHGYALATIGSPEAAHRAEQESYLADGGTVSDWYAMPGVATPGVPLSLPRNRPSLDLPELPAHTREQLLHEAVHATRMAVGRVPLSEAQEKLWEERVNLAYLELCLEAREHLATVTPRPWYTT